jgi:two-component system nitrogen regulation sensor histidine kinase GlnL
MILELQRESDRLNEHEQKSLDVVLSSINHMEEVVTRLLNYARPDPMQFEAGNINAIIEESLELAKPYLKKYQISLDKNLDKRLPDILMDKKNLREAFVNLITNAVHAISSNLKSGVRNKLSIKTTKKHLKSTVRESRTNGVHIEADSSGLLNNDSEIIIEAGTHVIQISFCDSGVGIGGEEINKVFNPFFTKNKSGGTGLGLTMVKRTVNSHQGIISVESDPGAGTCFTILLPLILNQNGID